MDKRNGENQHVAIKRVHSANIKTDYSNNACIEIQILKDFAHHPYFPTIRQVLVDKKTSSYSIVMSYFEHQSFEEYNKKLTEKETIQYIYRLLQCIEKLSEKGYVHRDINQAMFYIITIQNKL